MAENNTILRTTTIGLDEYNALKVAAESKEREIGSLANELENLKSNKRKENQNAEDSEPKIKVIHYDREWDRQYDDWCEDVEETPFLSQKKIEFVNLNDIQRVAKAEASRELNEKLQESNNKIKNLEFTVKSLREDIDTVQDRVEVKERQLSKVKASCKEEIEDLKEVQSKREKKLDKAYTDDVKAYKDTIKELKEEIQKVKDSKTDVELENVRNEEITTLKVRIADLEKILNDLNNTPWYKRIFKLRKVELEQNKAAQELRERKNTASHIGTTYVKENGKVRKYDSFKDSIQTNYNYISDYIYQVFGLTNNNGTTSYSKW